MVFNCVQALPMLHNCCSHGDSRSVCLHHVSLLDYFPFGVGAMEYHTELDILIVAGWCDPQDNGMEEPSLLVTTSSM